MSQDREPFLKERLFCPGPTPVPLEARLAAVAASSYHRTKEFEETLLACRRDLAPFFGTDGLPLILTSSGSGAMEAAVTNLTDVGDKVLVVVGGKFGDRWKKLAQGFGCQTHLIEIEWGKAPDPEAIAAFLKANQDTKAVFFQANETSTGVFYPVEAICKAIRDVSDCLIVVDGISALGAHEIQMDQWGIDCLVSGSQKGFGIPPGLAFIALSNQARAAISSRPRFYFDLQKEESGQAKGSTAWTPAATLVASLKNSLDRIGEMGVDGMVEHHRKMAIAVRQGIKALGLELFVDQHYSHALTAIKVPDGISGKDLKNVLQHRYGAVFAGGQDQLSGKIIRFAHLGFVDRFDVISGMAALEYGLRDLGYEGHKGFGSGVAELMAQI